MHIHREIIIMRDANSKLTLELIGYNKTIKKPNNKRSERKPLDLNFKTVFSTIRRKKNNPMAAIKPAIFQYIMF